jgi:hypothetical protein
MKKTTYFSSVGLLIATILISTVNIQAQDEESGPPISIGADLMSRYVWRGLDYGASPSIQPCIELGIGGFGFGAWGAYTTNLPGVQEMDLYLSYTFKDVVTVGVTDYFFPDELLGYDYFDYDTHVFEAFASFNGLEDLPLSAMFGINLAGDDENSLYFELGYSFSIFDVFLGAGDGIYTTDTDFMIVNAGITASKAIPITERFELPVSASLITNPEAKAIHLVFGVSF